MVVCNAIGEVECSEQGIAALKRRALPWLFDHFSTATAKIDGELLWKFWLWL
jgi:hypothetical protein